MKYLHLSFVFLILALLAARGAGHPTLVSSKVSPQQATASSSRTSSNAAIATIGDQTGQATCEAPGTVTITATAPANLNITINNGINNTSTNVAGTGTLICM